MNNYIERFNASERVLHWIVTVSFFTCLLYTSDAADE